MTRKSLAAALAALTLVLSAGTAFADPGQATGAVNIRAKASASSPIVGHLAAGEEVEIISCSGGWCRIEGGYVSAAYLALDDSDDADDEDDLDDDEDDEDEDEDDEDDSFLDEDDEFDDDPLDLEDSVPQSIHD